MNNDVIFLITLLYTTNYEGNIYRSLRGAVLAFRGDDVPENVREAPMERKALDWLYARLPQHMQHNAVIVDVDPRVVEDVVDLRKSDGCSGGCACEPKLKTARLTPAPGPTIVGFYGKAGSGKTTAASTLYDLVYKTDTPFSQAGMLAFADPIKRIAVDCFGWDGEKDDKGRRLLQIIGTEAGRHYNENIWIDKAMAHIEDSEENGYDLFVIHDVRFENEALAILGRGGVIVEITGRAADLGSNTGHASERGLPKQYIAHMLDNSGTLDELKDKLRDLLTWLPLPYGGKKGS